MKQEIQTIAEQIDFRQLALFGFKFTRDDEKLSLTLRKGCKYMKITLDLSKDMYFIETFKTRKFQLIVLDSKLSYCDSLQDNIEQFFNINYISKRVYG